MRIPDMISEKKTVFENNFQWYFSGLHLFVCFQGIDVKSMGRIFVGLVKCGAWGCFDEFNRLEEAVLSAVSMQIQAIQDSLKHHKNTCDLLGKEVRI